MAILARRQSIAPALAFSTSELRGDCTGATHVVTSVVRGAFTVSRRGKSETSASADVAAFGAVQVGQQAPEGRLRASAQAQGGSSKAPQREAAGAGGSGVQASAESKGRRPRMTGHRGAW